MIGFARKLVIVTWLPLTVLAVAAVVSEWFPSTFFPPLSRSLGATWQILTTEQLMRFLLPTLSTTVFGFGLGTLLALLFGTLVGFSVSGRAIFEPFIGFWRAAPASALVPLVIGVAGVGPSAVFWSVVTAVFLNVGLVVSVSISKADPATLNTMRVLGFGPLSIAFRARLPAAFGEIATGIQNGLQISLLVTVLAEVLSGGRGMGRYLMDSLDRYLIENLWAGIIVLGLVSAILNIAYRIVIERSFVWLEKGHRL